MILTIQERVTVLQNFVINNQLNIYCARINLTLFFFLYIGNFLSCSFFFLLIPLILPFFCFYQSLSVTLSKTPTLSFSLSFILFIFPLFSPLTLFSVVVQMSVSLSYTLFGLPSFLIGD